MNNEQYNQIIDEAYENYIAQTRIEFEKWRERNPDILVDYREDTKELFLKSIKEDTHWFTGEKKFSEKWGLKIEERELSFEERWDLSKKYGYRTGDVEMPSPDSIYLGVNERQELESLWNDPVIGTNLPTKLITITYKDKTIESYE